MRQIRPVSDWGNRFPDTEKMIEAVLDDTDQYSAKVTERMTHEEVFGKLRRKINAQ